MRRFPGVALASIVLAACAAPAPGASGSGTSVPATAATSVQSTASPGSAAREPNEQTFGPAYPAAQPAGDPTWISSAELSGDHTVLTIQFVGGPPYLASDPCSLDYEPWVAKNGDELDVVVMEVSRPDRASGGGNTFCTDVGYGHTYHLRLTQPFLGTTVNDLAQGGTLYVGTPDGTLEATTLPTGWTLQRSFQEEPGPPPVWVEIYASAPVGEAWEGPGQLVLYQAFGIMSEWSDTRAIKAESRGARPVDVTFGGKPAVVWVDGDSGELLLAWEQGGRSLGIIGNSADMTPADLVRFAEGVGAGS